MLKIKDNVDLKELEKFGFEKDEYKEDVEMVYNYEEFRTEEIRIYKNKEISIYIDDELYCCAIDTEFLEVLFDLIQAGLVEKVED